LGGLLEALASSASDLLEAGEVFVILADRVTGTLNFASTESTAIGPEYLYDLKSFLEAKPDLLQKLARGEQALLDADLDSLSLSGHILLTPLVHSSGYEGLLCVLFPASESQPSAAKRDQLRALCQQVAPILARTRELEALRSENVELRQQALRISELEESIANAVRARSELEAVAQTRSQLLAKIPHELRTPLVAIRGYTKMILDERAGPINSTQREYLTIVSENSNRLVSLINWISNLVQLTGEKLRLEFVDLRELWREARRTIQAAATESSIKITEKIPSEPFTVLGDREKLAQVFNILVQNAVKFTDRDGEISVEFSGGPEEERTVRISDTGVGIPPELLGKIFERHHPAESQPQRGNDAAGMGFSIVHDIIRLHGGKIAVNSKVGEGSSFVFTMPPLKPRA
jgi:signal transduction histidine kinase